MGKEVGMDIRDRNGRFILPDDPLFDPIYAFLADRGKPLLAHLGEPLAAWLPLDPENVHYGYYLRYRDRILYGLDRTREPTPEGKGSAEERLNFARSLEQSYRLDYRYYAGAGEMEYRGKTGECLNLPTEVLEKFFHGNALQVVPGLE
jgi:predicted TIM-barrel fold metal-dependent hydrolase